MISVDARFMVLLYYSLRLTQCPTSSWLAELNKSKRPDTVLLLKKVVAVATRERRNQGIYFATLWKRRLSIVTRTAMITQAHYALPKQEQDDMSDLWAW